MEEKENSVLTFSRIKFNIEIDEQFDNTQKHRNQHHRQFTEGESVTLESSRLFLFVPDHQFPVHPN